MSANRLVSWHKAFTRWARPRAQQHPHELGSMGPRELADLGIGRSEVPAVLNSASAWREDRAGRAE